MFCSLMWGGTPCSASHYQLVAGLPLSIHPLHTPQSDAAFDHGPGGCIRQRHAPPCKREPHLNTCCSRPLSRSIQDVNARACPLLSAGREGGGIESNTTRVTIRWRRRMRAGGGGRRTLRRRRALLGRRSRTSSKEARSRQWPTGRLPMP